MFGVCCLPWFCVFFLLILLCWIALRRAMTSWPNPLYYLPFSSSVLCCSWHYQLYISSLKFLPCFLWWFTVLTLPTSLLGNLVSFYFVSSSIFSLIISFLWYWFFFPIKSHIYGCLLRSSIWIPHYHIQF